MFFYHLFARTTITKKKNQKLLPDYHDWGKDPKCRIICNEHSFPSATGILSELWFYCIFRPLIYQSVLINYDLKRCGINRFSFSGSWMKGFFFSLLAAPIMLLLTNQWNFCTRHQGNPNCLEIKSGPTSFALIFWNKQQPEIVWAGLSLRFLGICTVKYLWRLVHGMYCEKETHFVFRTQKVKCCNSLPMLIC